MNGSKSRIATKNGTLISRKNWMEIKKSPEKKKYPDPLNRFPAPRKPNRVPIRKKTSMKKIFPPGNPIYEPHFPNPIEAIRDPRIIFSLI